MNSREMIQRNYFLPPLFTWLLSNCLRNEASDESDVDTPDRKASFSSELNQSAKEYYNELIAKILKDGKLMSAFELFFMYVSYRSELCR